MAKATIRRDKRGDLYLFLSGVVDGERVRVAKRIPDDDGELGERAATAHNARFLAGDVTELRKAIENRKRPTKPATNRTRRRSGERLGRWRDTWIESQRGLVSEHTWRTLRSSIAGAVELLGEDRFLEELRPADFVALRADLVRSGRSRVTIARKLADMKRCLDAAVLSGLLAANPLEVSISARRTKRDRAVEIQSTDASLPLSVAELGRFLDVVRNPDPLRPIEVAWFPLTEALALTGLRYGEVAGLRWPLVDVERRRVRICHALEHYSPTTDAPTKTGAAWTIPLRAPLGSLIARQRERVFLLDPEGWVFPTVNGAAPSYQNWRNRVWPTVIRRAKIALGSPGDAQKLLRKMFITSSLVCGRNAKRVASEVGHSSLRMVTDHYERFVDPDNWPTTSERNFLVDVYGFEDVQVETDKAREEIA